MFPKFDRRKAPADFDWFDYEERDDASLQNRLGRTLDCAASVGYNRLMFYELKDIRQDDSQGFRRWFWDDEMDLIVWCAEDSSITGFQLCYDKRGHERVLAWNQKSGHSHHGIDAGEAPFGAKRSPLLVADGTFDKTRVSERFKRCAQDLEPDLIEFVVQRLVSAP